MNFVVESFTVDAITTALIEIYDTFRGRYYTIEEISRITGGVPVDKLEKLLMRDPTRLFGPKFTFERVLEFRLRKVVLQLIITVLTLLRYLRRKI